MTEPSCQICHAAHGARVQAHERMLGLGDPFWYWECRVCGCVQLLDPPTDWARYYPTAYYAFAAPPERTGLRGLLRKVRNRGTFRGAPWPARLLARAMGYPLTGAEHWFPAMGLAPSDRILDVGCGSGMLVRDLVDAGFVHTVGIDPYLAGDRTFANGARVQRAMLTDVDGPFDAIMLHHSLEHMPDQLDTLRAVAERLRPGGQCLVRVPVTSSWAWEHYREHWVQLDAPRHLFVHSQQSLQRVAADAGLTLTHTMQDSTAFQILGSTLYQQDRPLADLVHVERGAPARDARAQARRLNASGRGDQVACIFRRA